MSPHQDDPRIKRLTPANARAIQGPFYAIGAALLNRHAPHFFSPHLCLVECEVLGLRKLPRNNIITVWCTIAYAFPFSPTINMLRSRSMPVMDHSVFKRYNSLLINELYVFSKTPASWPAGCCNNG